MEFFRELGNRTGALWAYFEDAESGDLTMLGALILAAFAIATAARCFHALRPALGEARLAGVVGVGAAITAVFGGVGLFFLYLAATSGA